MSYVIAGPVVFLALALAMGSAQAADGRFDCAPGESTQLSAVPGGVLASWACIVSDGTGYRYSWNRAVAATGFLPDVPAIRKALAAPEPVAALNALLANRKCADSPAIQALCDEAQRVEQRSTASLPTLWQTRPASWGGVSVYRLTSAGPDLGAPVGVIGRALCDCAAWSGSPRADNSRLCQTQPGGVSFCFPAP